MRCDFGPPCTIVFNILECGKDISTTDKSDCNFKLSYSELDSILSSNNVLKVKFIRFTVNQKWISLQQDQKQIEQQ